MDELLEQFLIEGRDLMAQATADLAALARDPQAAGPLDSAFRAIHTLKGSVAIFAMVPAERVLHAAEDVLERARKGTAPLDSQGVAALLACLDAVDRWIDEVAQAGALGADADAVAAAVVAGLPRTGATSDGSLLAERPDWLDALAMRERERIADAKGPLVAFRYVPDAQCFFRGDDPLAIVAGVPQLDALAVLPRDAAWPALDAMEPFACISILEGVSSAPIEEVKHAFRLVADQVQLAPIALHAQYDPASAENAASTLRVEVGRIDALADGLGELIVATNMLAVVAEDAAKSDRILAARIRAAQAEIDARIATLRHSVNRVRLVPLAPTLRRLPRLVREIAAGLGKRVTFTITGEALEVDKQIADALFEPLLHLIRNAVDHGIEPAEVRLAAGKPAEGQVLLAARRDGDAIHVTLSDDGAGIDPARLREIAVARGLVSTEAAGALDDAASLRLIFTPGFSTAPETTGISGRGVGMDAVQATIDKRRGTIEIESAPGRGTQFHLRMPAQALTTRLLVVQAGVERYGVALDQIVETVRVGSEALMPVGDGQACILRGRTVPVLSLAALLGGVQQSAANAKLLVTRAGGEQVALLVDGFAERLDTVVRPASGMLAGFPGVAGSALLGDGSLLLVLDLPALAA